MIEGSEHAVGTKIYIYIYFFLFIFIYLVVLSLSYDRWDLRPLL